MTIKLPRFRRVLYSSALLAVSFTVTPAASADGSCMYKKLSPGARQWYAACKMPATPKTCDEWAMSPGVSEANFSEKDCPTTGAVGACVVQGVTQYYYKMSETAAAEGCGHAKGQWQPGAKPGGKS
jgi:hypothetical protein